MIAIIDNDVVLKIARWNLLSELIELLGGDSELIYHLPTCVHALCGRPSRMKKVGCDEASAGRIRAFCSTTRPLSDNADPLLLETLAAISGIDAGEVLIFASATGSHDSVTYMGDKRSLLALAGAGILGELMPLLDGRVKCLEQVMGELILQEGVEAIGRKVLACAPPADIAVTLVFRGKDGMRPNDDIWAGLESYYLDLKSRTGGLLAPFPVAPATL